MMGPHWFLLAIILGSSTIHCQKNHSKDGQYDHSHDGAGWDIRLSVPGEPQVDYPTLNYIPRTAFNCVGKNSGYYADSETRCQVFRVCATNAPGGYYSFLCPNGTLFNQKVLVCDWWMNVNCDGLDYETIDSDKGKLQAGPAMLKDVQKMITYPMHNSLPKEYPKQKMTMQIYNPPDNMMSMFQQPQDDFSGQELLGENKSPNHDYKPTQNTQYFRKDSFVSESGIYKQNSNINQFQNSVSTVPSFEESLNRQLIQQQEEILRLQKEFNSNSQQAVKITKQQYTYPSQFDKQYTVSVPQVPAAINRPLIVNIPINIPAITDNGNDNLVPINVGEDQYQGQKTISFQNIDIKNVFGSSSLQRKQNDQTYSTFDKQTNTKSSNTANRFSSKFNSNEINQQQTGNRNISPEDSQREDYDQYRITSSVDGPKTYTDEENQGEFYSVQYGFSRRKNSKNKRPITTNAPNLQVNENDFTDNQQQVSVQNDFNQNQNNVNRNFAVSNIQENTNRNTENKFIKASKEESVYYTQKPASFDETNNNRQYSINNQQIQGLQKPSPFVKTPSTLNQQNIGGFLNNHEASLSYKNMQNIITPEHQVTRYDSLKVSQFSKTPQNTESNRYQGQITNQNTNTDFGAEYNTGNIKTNDASRSQQVTNTHLYNNRDNSGTAARYNENSNSKQINANFRKQENFQQNTRNNYPIVQITVGTAEQDVSSAGKLSSQHQTTNKQSAITNKYEQVLSIQRQLGGENAPAPFTKQNTISFQQELPKTTSQTPQEPFDVTRFKTQYNGDNRRENEKQFYSPSNVPSKVDFSQEQGVKSIQSQGFTSNTQVTNTNSFQNNVQTQQGGNRKINDQNNQQNLQGIQQQNRFDTDVNRPTQPKFNQNSANLAGVTNSNDLYNLGLNREYIQTSIPVHNDQGIYTKVQIIPAFGFAIDSNHEREDYFTALARGLQNVQRVYEPPYEERTAMFTNAGVTGPAQTVSSNFNSALFQNEQLMKNFPTAQGNLNVQTSLGNTFGGFQEQSSFGVPQFSAGGSVEVLNNNNRGLVGVLQTENVPHQNLPVETFGYPKEKPRISFNF